MGHLKQIGNLAGFRSYPTPNKMPNRDTHLAQHPSVVRHAFTYEAIQQHVTATTILTWVAGTFVPLDLTVGAYKSRWTLAVVSSQCPFLKTNQMIKYIENEMPVKDIVLTAHKERTRSEKIVPCRWRHSGIVHGSHLHL